jgi:type I restriction enzyme S subunit
MNPAQLLDHFDRISDAPDAIPRLRRLILDLAVRGKLVVQDPCDEPASELLRHIQAVKARLVKAARLSKQEAPLAVEEDSVPFQVPKHWTWLQLSELGILSGGMTPSKNRPDFWDGTINWFSPKDIKSDELIESELKITLAGATETGLQVYPPGCLFMVARSGILKRTFPVAINRVDATANQDLKVLRPFVAGLERYLQIMFRGMTEFILSSLVKTGTTVQSLKYEQFELQPVPLPPLAEQRRIVAKVDELMAQCDELEAAQRERERRRDRLSAASLQRLSASPDTPALREYADFHIRHLARFTTRPDQIRALRQAVLSLGMRGRLVRQDAADESALALLDRISVATRRFATEHAIAAPKPEPIDEESVPYSAPPGWSWTRLCSLFYVITDGDHLPPPKADDGIAFLTIGNITTGHLDFTGCRFVSPEYFQSVAIYRRPVRGDILYTVVGATYGRPALVDTDRGFCIQRHIAILKPSSEVDVRFLLRLLASPVVYKQATLGTTGTAQPTIPLRALRNFLVPLPPVSEQRRIVARIDELMDLCDRLEAQLTTAQVESHRLLDAVLHEALATDSTEMANASQ